ncbi:M23 family metallopeptidase, partial [Staphylococcus aureus]|uniref:M23 family metallopeptidase n=1 Tax=Staphylococcus aureus TaxID=1280 RepID=UPI00160F884D
MDIGGIPEGTPINAVMGGTVIGTNMEGEEGGNILKIDSGNGIEWRYVHIANGTTVVKPGQQVKAGDHLAGAG